MTGKKDALERRISSLLGERDGLSINLDETSDRIIALERHNREQEVQVVNSSYLLVSFREYPNEVTRSGLFGLDHANNVLLSPPTLSDRILPNGEREREKDTFRGVA